MLLAGYAIDVWFLYGSFAYGLEASVEAWGIRELRLAIHMPDEAARLEVTSFLERLTENPRGLLRCEIRIFSKLPPMVSLVTERIPVIESEDSGQVTLLFREVGGITESDEQHWQSLARSIWPRLLS